MKKILMLIIAGAFVTAYANVDINWMASGGFYFSATPWVGILGSGTGNSTIAQLIYSLDANVDDALVGGGASGNDVVWATKTITEDGIDNDSTMFDSYALFDKQNYTQAFTSGYVYARIFQDSSVGYGDWYYASTPVALQDITGINPSQNLELNTDTSNGNAIDSGINAYQVVPEPATIGLMALGGGLAWLIRLKQRLS